MNDFRTLEMPTEEAGREWAKKFFKEVCNTPEEGLLAYIGFPYLMLMVTATIAIASRESNTLEDYLDGLTAIHGGVISRAPGYWRAMQKRQAEGEQ